MKTFTEIPRQLNPIFWMNARNSNAFSGFMSYQNLLTITVSGTGGSTTLTSSSGVDNFVIPGQEIRVNGDIYTTTSVIGTSITVSTPLVSNYSGIALQVQRVSRYTDSSNAAVHVSNATVNNQIIYARTGLFGQPCFVLNGGQRMTASTLPISGNPSLSIYWVGLSFTGADAFAVFIGSTVGSKGIGSARTPSTSFTSFQWADLSVNSASSITTSHIVRTVKNATLGTLSIRLNLNAAVTQSCPSLNGITSNITIGGADPGQNCIGRISEVVVFDRVLTVEEDALLMDYLQKENIVP